MAKVFVSYRRADNAAGYAMDLARILRATFGERHVFRDMRSIPPGVDFGLLIKQALENCAVMLVMIGRHWVNERTEDGRLRLFEPDDWVRIEVATALASPHVRVIPVLVGGATLPRADQLPADLQPLLKRNAESLGDRKWESDVAALITELEKMPGLRSWWQTLWRKRGRGMAAARTATKSGKLRIAMAAVAATIVVLGIVGVIVDETIHLELVPDVQPPDVQPLVWEPANVEPSDAYAALPQKQLDTSPAAIATPPTVLDVAGIWQDSDGNRYRFLQDDEDIDIEQIWGPGALMGGFGHGYLEDRLFDFDFFLQGMQSSGRLTLAPDGRSMQGQFRDGSTGAVSPLYLIRL